MGLRRKKSLIDQAGDYVDAVKPQIESAVASAKDKALPLIADARDRATPVIVDAREKAGPALADARAKAAPVIATGAALAADRATQAASLAAEKAAIGRDLAAAKVAQVKGEPEPKGGKLKKVLLLGGLLAVGGVVLQKLRGSSDSDNWQSSYTPTPPPTATTPTAVPDAGDDGAGSSPDEALADAAEEPHPVSTPDDPAEVISVDEDARNN